MRQLINHERIVRGKDPLKMTARLVKIARRHSHDMADDGTIYHNPKLSSQVSYCDPSLWGENVGMGGTVPALHDLFMASPPHRKNILKAAYDHIGVGVVKQDGTLYATVVFVSTGASKVAFPSVGQDAAEGSGLSTADSSGSASEGSPSPSAPPPDEPGSGGGDDQVEPEEPDVIGTARTLLDDLISTEPPRG